jgi:hypothetical protein
MLQSSYAVFSSWRDLYSLKTWVSGDQGLKFDKAGILQWIERFSDLLNCKDWDQDLRAQLDNLFDCSPEMGFHRKGKPFDDEPTNATTVPTNASLLPPWAASMEQGFSPACSRGIHASPGDAWDGKLHRAINEVSEIPLTPEPSKHAPLETSSTASPRVSANREPSCCKSGSDGGGMQPPISSESPMPSVRLVEAVSGEKPPVSLESLPVVWELHYSAKAIHDVCDDSWQKNFAEIAALSREAHDKVVDLVEALSIEGMGRVHRTHVLSLGSTRYGLLCPEPLVLPAPLPWDADLSPTPLVAEQGLSKEAHCFPSTIAKFHE